MWLLIFFALVGLGIFLYFKFFKIPRIKNIVFVDGSLGSGKSYYSVSLAMRLYKKAVFRWRVSVVLVKFLGLFSKKYKDMKIEKPVLCSNIYLRGVPFVPLNMKILTRQVRLPFKSVFLIDEISLLADQMLFKDKKVNDTLSIFFKLFRHANHGGHLIINSQSTSDLHFSLKYVLSDYLYIHSKVRLPFFSILRVQELAYCGDKDGRNITNVNNGDLSENLKMMLVSNRYYKSYDTYCFSTFTDGLPVFRKVREFAKGDSLKSRDLVTFRDWEFLKEYHDSLNKERS